MRYRLIQASGLILMLMYSTQIFASPTSNEFGVCKKLAVRVLEGCLLKSSYYANEHCWKDSSNSYQSCYHRVMNSHNPELRKKKEAMKEKLMRAHQDNLSKKHQSENSDSGK